MASSRIHPSYVEGLIRKCDIQEREIRKLRSDADRLKKLLVKGGGVGKQQPQPQQPWREIQVVLSEMPTGSKRANQQVMLARQSARYACWKK